jgi:hypothetical protein
MDEDNIHISYGLGSEKQVNYKLKCSKLLLDFIKRADKVYKIKKT